MFMNDIVLVKSMIIVKQLFGQSYVVFKLALESQKVERGKHFKLTEH